jgi:tetratricopeptide (TPR) repeat protein
MRLFVTKVDATQADAAATAFQEYMAAEPDPAKKSKAQYDLAQMLLDSGSADKAIVEFQKILAEKPDDPDANLGVGLAMFSTGDKAKFQEAANYLQKFVDKAPDTHKFKNDAKAVLAELKSTENVTPEKTTKPATRKRP